MNLVQGGAPTAFAFNPEVFRDRLQLVGSGFLFPGSGNKLRHEEGEHSGLLGGPPSFLQESQQSSPLPLPPIPPAAVQIGRESLPACFLELGLDRGRKGSALGGRSV